MAQNGKHNGVSHGFSQYQGTKDRAQNFVLGSVKRDLTEVNGSLIQASGGRI